MFHVGCVFDPRHRTVEVSTVVRRNDSAAAVRRSAERVQLRDLVVVLQCNASNAPLVPRDHVEIFPVRRDGDIARTVLVEDSARL